MPLYELYILDAALLVVIIYSARRVDPMDGPLALCRLVMLTTDLGIQGARQLWFFIGGVSKLYSYSIDGFINLLFVLNHLVIPATSYRYQRGRWPSNLVYGGRLLRHGLKDPAPETLRDNKKL